MLVKLNRTSIVTNDHDTHHAGSGCVKSLVILSTTNAAGSDDVSYLIRISIVTY